MSSSDSELEHLDVEEISDAEEEQLSSKHKAKDASVNNEPALARILSNIGLSLPFAESLSLTHAAVDPELSASDDLNVEMHFYKSALASASRAQKQFEQLSLPFSRPNDFYAEQIKSDAHMERIRQRLLNEGADIKRSEEKRREREGKKFGKQVQVETLKDRERRKKEVEKAVSGLKRKRGDVLDGAGGDEEFDIQVEAALDADRPTSKRGRSDRGGRGGRGRGQSRESRDAKFGFGGKGRRDKSNTRASTDDFGGSSRGRGGSRGGARGRGARRGSSSRGGTKRLGKSRRESSRN